MSPDQCPACNESTSETLEGIPEPICTECGFVISNDGDPPPCLEKQKAAQGPQEWSEYYSVTNETEKQVAQGLESLLSLAEELDLSTETVSEAAEIFTDAALNTLANGRSWRLIVAATVCTAARATGEPRPTGRVADLTDLDPNELQNAIRLLQRSLDYEYPANSPSGHIPFICDKLGIVADEREQAEQLVDRYLETHNVVGKDPVGIACASIYQATNNGVTQREIADVAGITPETIRVRLQELRGMEEATHG